jgi:16S rRNA (uracil1498-N3)-methyltransferase
MVLSLLPPARLKPRRFFLKESDLNKAEIVVTGELFRHMARVLRLQPGDSVILADGEGNEATGTIAEIFADSIRLNLSAPTCSNLKAEDAPAITLYQGLPKGDKMDLIVQKCTELGVAGIVPFMAGRSVVKIGSGQLQKKIDRWQRIAMEAARQSEQVRIPGITVARDMAEAVDIASQQVRLLVWESATVGLKDFLMATPPPDTAAIIIGPEGGIAEKEAELAISHGFHPVSLGRSILRTETAGFVTLAILQYQWGKLG